MVQGSDREKDLAAAFVELADTLNAGREIVDLMDLLVQYAVRFTSAVEAGVLLAGPGGDLHVIASSSERTSDVEEAQLGSEAGPCLEAFATGLSVDVPSVSDSRGEWQEFSDIAFARGFRAAHATPLELRGQRLGGLNVFFLVEGSTSAAELALLGAFARITAVSLAQQQAARAQLTITDQLRFALDSRIIIEQAKGVIAQRNGISVDLAFRMLRNYARSTNAHLRELSEQVVSKQLEL